MEVVAVAADAWRRWRALRLAALAEAPQAFGSTLAGWSGAGDTEERWRDRLASVPHNLVVVRAGEDVGMVSLAAPAGGEPPELIGMWVAPPARGTGVADAAVTAVLALAAEAYPGRAVVLSVYADNAAARRLYARHGFTDAGPSPDGEGELRMVHDAAARRP
ncbi:GNAT family N-acetyltransferase [Microlunatus spumicola]|uniref:GNAT family N-acetyltransferase n=1 Tax=Microlunatus spumicola TaxID=81499 RepID=A0ABP6XPZ5_9ACTN